MNICHLTRLAALRECGGVMQRLPLGLLLVLAVASAERMGAEESYTVVDDRGVEVEFCGVPERVVSLVPSVTEVIFALGAEAKLAGVTTFCDYPPEAKLKPKVGDFSNPSLERISALEPEVVFATTPEQRPAIDALENLGFKVFCIQPESVEGTLGAVEKTGIILSAQSAADSLVRQLRRRLDQVSSLLRNVDRRTVYIEIAAGPLMTATENSFVGELITTAGGENVAKGPKPYMAINSETVVREDPEVIIIAHPGCEPENVKDRVGWEIISAIRDNRVYEVNPDLVLRPGPRMVDGILEFLQKIHPEMDLSTSECTPQRRTE